MHAMHTYSNNNTGHIDMLLKLPGVLRYRHSDLCLIPLESFPIPELIPFWLNWNRNRFRCTKKHAEIRIRIRVALRKLESEFISHL